MKPTCRDARYRLRCLVRDALLAAILVFSKELLAALPNVEIVSMLLMAYAAVYRLRALLPLYLFVVIEAVLYPSVLSTMMYAYVWLFLVIPLLLLPRRTLPAPVYMGIGGLFGLAFGLLCAPAQALYYGLDGEGILAWYVAGFPFDVIHAVGNVATGVLTPVLIRLLLRLEGRAFHT